MSKTDLPPTEPPGGGGGGGLKVESRVSVFITAWPTCAFPESVNTNNVRPCGNSTRVFRNGFFVSFFAYILNRISSGKV